MPFINDNPENLSVALTIEGRKIIAKNGFTNLQLYCELIDTATIYTLDSYPSLGLDFKGDSNNIVHNLINTKYKIT